MFEAEGPGRLTKVFEQIFLAAHVVYAGDLDRAIRVTARIALDSIVPGRRAKLIRLLAATESGVTVRQGQAALHCDDNTARQALNDLVHIRFATTATPVKTALYWPSPQLLDLAAQVFLDEFEPKVALRKLSDLPTHIPSTRGREKEGSGTCQRQWDTLRD